jgi:acetolactate synthase-1/2/3 large subunit
VEKCVAGAVGQLNEPEALVRSEPLDDGIDGQHAVFGNRIIATTFKVQPDFTAIAAACGCRGEKVVEPDEVRPALERALAANAAGVPAVIDFHVAQERVAGSIDFFTKR